MQVNRVIALSIALGAVLCASCERSKTKTTHIFVPRFTAAACPASATQVTAPVTCGTVEVLENRAKPGSRHLKLFVAVIHTPAADKVADAVMLLNGGPSPALDNVFAGLSQPGAEAMLGRRDFVSFDYRGMGYSTPNVTCPTDANGGVDEATCASNLSKNQVDPAGYTDTAMAADAEDIRTALKLGALNLWGTSYGSRVALILARDYPAAVRSMILDGTLAAQTRRDAALVSEQAAVIHSLFDHCAMDKVCGPAFPSVAERFAAAIPLINNAPLMVDGKPWSGDDLALQVQGATADASLNAYVPLLAEQAARGTLSTIPWNAASPDLGPNYAPVQRLVACGAGVFTSDAAGLTALSQAADEIVAAMARNEIKLRAYCAFWPATAASPSDKESVSSAIPTLIFNGEYDANTPLAEALKAQTTLSNSQLMTFPGFGHVAFGAPCAGILALQFVETLNQMPLDESCLQTLGEPAWVTQL